MAYSVKIVTAPTSTAVSLSEAKAFLSLDDQSTAFDTLLTSLIRAATAKIEDYTGRAIVTQTAELTSDCLPCSIVELPLAGPLQSITSVTIKAEDLTITTVDGADYVADTDATPGRLILKPSASWPAVSMFPFGGFKVRYVVGTEVANVPEIFKLAVTYYVGFLFENRDADPKLPKVVQDLLYTHRINSPVPVLRGL